MIARKKPVEIEFFTFEELVVIADNTTQFNFNGHRINYYTEHNKFVIPTLEGNHEMTNKDVLIIGVKGEIYPCKKDIFEITYDLVIEESFLDRLIKEEFELGIKINALSTFLNKDHSNKIVGDLLYSYLNVQRSAMIAYRQIIIIRIEDLKSKEKQ